MFFLFPLVGAAVGAAVGAFSTHAAGEKDRQSAKHHRQIANDLTAKYSELEKRYHEYTESSKRDIRDLTQQHALDEAEKGLLRLAIRLQQSLYTLMWDIDGDPTRESLVKFEQAVLATNTVLFELKEEFIQVPDKYFSRNLERAGEATATLPGDVLGGNIYPIQKCPNCGRKNRIIPHNLDLKLICGSCRSVIPLEWGMKTGLSIDEISTPRHRDLVRYEFETVQADAQGKVTQRTKREAELFIEDLGKSIRLEMVRIPGGEFVMGSPVGEAGRCSDEGPQRRVQVPEFYLGKFTVTQAQWKQVAALPKQQRDLTPNPAGFEGANHPVNCVSWDDAQEFCARLSRASGKAYRLPSEAEWEYACRAGTTTPFHFGETISTALANYDGRYTRITDVGSFPANAFGLYDMHGNVWEWCEDDWHGNYEGALTDGSAWKNSSQRYRLLRGGFWSSNPTFCRSAVRDRDNRNSSRVRIGFRVACRVSPRSA